MSRLFADNHQYERSYADLQQQLENIEQGQLETEGNYEAANKKSEAKMQEMRKKVCQCPLTLTYSYEC